MNSLSIFHALTNRGFDPKVIFDIGAFHGVFSSQMKSIFNNARIIAVEGNDACEPYLKEYDYTITLVGEKKGQVDFYMSNKEDGTVTGNSILQELTPYYDNYRIEKKNMVTISEIMHDKNVKHIDLLKMDIQGYELKALQGIDKIDLDNIEFILLETSMCEYNNGQALFHDIYNFLYKNDFTLFSFIEEHKIADIPFQTDILFVNVKSSFRPFFGVNNIMTGNSNIYNIKITDGGRLELMDYISKEKQKRKFTVVSVGDQMIDVDVDAIIDIKHHDKDVIKYRIDICDKDQWDKVIEYVKINGKFDFSVCINTLEKIRDPYFVSKMLSKISKSGYIAVTSKYRELSKIQFNGQFYRGYIDHRWIFNIENNKLIGYPKLNFLEYMTDMNKVADVVDNKKDLSFYWYNGIPFELVKINHIEDNSLITEQHIINYYNNLVDK